MRAWLSHASQSSGLSRPRRLAGSTATVRLEGRASTTGPTSAPDGDKCISFQQVEDYRAPEWPGQEVPQQMHLDVVVDDLDAAEAAVLDWARRSTSISPARRSGSSSTRPGTRSASASTEGQRALDQVRDHVGDGRSEDRYFRGSVRAGSATRARRTAPGEGDVQRGADVDLADAGRRWPRAAARRGTPDEPCSTSGTGTTAAMRAIRSQSSVRGLRRSSRGCCRRRRPARRPPWPRRTRPPRAGRCARPARARRPCRRSRRARPRPRARGRAASRVTSAVRATFVVVVELAGVVHHRADAELRHRRASSSAGSVTWSRCSDGGRGMRRARVPRRRAAVGAPPVVVADRVLADLQHDRSSGALGTERGCPRRARA